MAFLSQHRVNQVRGKSVNLTLRDLQKGMIIEAKYSSMTNEGKKGKPNNYMFLILNPSYKTPGTILPKVHALSMDLFSPQVLNKMAEDIGVRYIPKFQKTVGLDVPKLIMEQSSQRFYSQKIRREIKTKYENSYRTLLPKNFSRIRLVDYKFNKKILKKFLGE